MWFAKHQSVRPSVDELQSVSAVQPEVLESRLGVRRLLIFAET